MNLQTLVTEKLTESIDNIGLTATVEKDYSNTGYILAIDDELDTQWAIRFDFQTTYFSLELYKGSPQFKATTHRGSTINGATTSAVINAIVERMVA